MIKIVILMITLLLGLPQTVMGEEDLSSPKVLYSQGRSELRKGDYNKALDYFQKAIQVNPEYAEAYFSMGYCYQQLGKHREAIEPYKKTIQIKPDYPTAYFNLGVAYSRLHRDEEAIEPYKKAIHFKPNYVEAYENLGWSYNEIGKYAEAIEILKHAIRLRPNLAFTYNTLGVSYDSLNRNQEAIQAYEQAIRLDPNFALAYFNLGRIYFFKLKRYEEARKKFEKALSLNPYDSISKSMLTQLEKMGFGPITPGAIQLVIEKQVPSFTLIDLNGNLSEFKPARGKVTILGFYSVWCGVSLAPVAKLKEIEEKFKDKDVQVVAAIFLHGSAKPMLKPSVERYKLNFPILVGESGFLEMAFEDLEEVKKGNQETISFLRKVRGLEEVCHRAGMMPLKPLILIVDKKGTIRFIHQDYPDMDVLNKEIESLIG